jgi:hypothetical protein
MAYDQGVGPTGGPCNPGDSEMSSELREESRASDREMNAARTMDEMRDAVHQRRLIRAACEFERAMEQYERRNTVIGPIRESYRRLRRGRELGAAAGRCRA